MLLAALARRYVPIARSLYRTQFDDGYQSLVYEEVIRAVRLIRDMPVVAESGAVVLLLEDERASGVLELKS